jgi:phage shock protein A
VAVGILDRIAKKLKEGTTAALAPAVDPREVNLTSHQKQRALLEQVARAIQEVIAARGRLEASAESVRAKLPELEAQARSELQAGRRNMARLALQRRQVAVVELATLERQLAEVEREEVALSMVEQRLSTQIEAFAARQEVIRARYSAAEAQVRINEAVTGVSEDFADLAAALQRAEEKTESMQARATAIDKLVAEGDLESVTETTSGELPKLPGGDQEVENQLAALEADLQSQAG